MTKATIFFLRFCISLSGSYLKAYENINLFNGRKFNYLNVKIDGESILKKNEKKEEEGEYRQKEEKNEIGNDERNWRQMKTRKWEKNESKRDDKWERGKEKKREEFMWVR